MEKYFLQIASEFDELDTYTIGLRYSDKSSQFMIGGLGRDREFIEYIAMQYFNLDVLSKDNGIEERWPQRNKMRFVCKMDRREFLKGLHGLRETYPVGVIKTKSLGRLVR